MQIETQILIEEPVGRLRFKFANSGTFTFVSPDLILQAKKHLEAIDALMQLQLYRMADPDYGKEKPGNTDN